MILPALLCRIKDQGSRIKAQSPASRALLQLPAVHQKGLGETENEEKGSTRCTFAGATISGTDSSTQAPLCVFRRDLAGRQWKDHYLHLPGDEISRHTQGGRERGADGEGGLQGYVPF